MVLYSNKELKTLKLGFVCCCCCCCFKKNSGSTIHHKNNKKLKFSFATSGFFAKNDTTYINMQLS